MADIDRLPGISEDEVNNLAKMGIRTIDELWGRVGSNQDADWKTLTEDIGIGRSRLVDLLTAQALQEMETHDNRWWQRFAWAALRIVLLIGPYWLMFRFPSLITPLGFLMLLVCIVIGLSLRAVVTLDWLPLPLRLPAAIPVAARHLEKQDRLQKGDLKLARIPASDDTIRHLDQLGDLEKLTLQRAVRRGQPLRYSDLQRLQVTAVQPIAAGKSITADAIAVTQSTFNPQAVLSPDHTRGRVALQPFAVGDVLLSDRLVDASTRQQVVISATRLEPFQSIPSTSLMLGPAPADGEGFKNRSDVVGHVSLRPIPEGKVIRQADISPAMITSDELANLQILSLPVGRGAYSTGTAPGARVTVIISPQEVGGQAAVTLSDALILAIDLLPDGGAAFVFAVQTNLSNLAPVLGSGKVFVMQKPPELTSTP